MKAQEGLLDRPYKMYKTYKMYGRSERSHRLVERIQPRPAGRVPYRRAEYARDSLHVGTSVGRRFQ